MPPESVLAAFGATSPPVRLAGGQGMTWACGDLVLKPTDDADEAAWLAELAVSLPQRGFRLARPVAAADGRWVVDGWTAQRRIDGASGVRGRWGLALRAAQAFHAALAPLPYAPVIGRRTHRWARADRVAWGEEAPDVLPEVAALLRRLGPTSARPALPKQLVHADLAGNLLLADGQPPGIVDLSLYWRPARWGEAQVVVDGLLWYGAPPSLIAGDEQWRQLLLRSCAFRLVALDGRAREEGPACLDELSQHARVVELLLG